MPKSRSKKKRAIFARTHRHHASKALQVAPVMAKPGQSRRDEPGASKTAELEDLSRMVLKAAEASPALTFARVLSDVTNVYKGAAALGPALDSVSAPASPQMARSVQASINRWRRVFEEHHFLGSVGVSEALGARSFNRSIASDQRSKGKLLGVKRGNTFMYPEFQFDLDAHRVRPIIPELIELARASDWSDENLVLWLVTPTGFLDDTRPIDHWDEPDRILAGARSRFEPAW